MSPRRSQRSRSRPWWRILHLQPFFLWFDATRMHVWTHLRKESAGKTGVGPYPDGMVEHDGHVGQLLITVPDYPFQAGAALNAAGINYDTLRAQEVLRRLQQMENFSPPRN